MKKKLVRHGVFETNSSSSHSISIADSTKEFVLETIYPDQNGNIQLTGGEFGWDWEKYNDAITKANYCAVDSIGNDNNREMLIEVIKEQTGAEHVEILCDNDYDKPHYSYIDHQSYGTAGEAFGSKEKLKNFIFNKNSWLFTGNDNSTADPTFFHVPEFKGGRQILPVYKFELEVEGYSKKTRFLSKPTEEELGDALNALLQGVHLHESGHFDDDNSIGMQLMRDRNRCFEFSTWRKPVDFKKKIVFFIKDDAAFEEAKRQWDRENPNADWQKDHGYSKVDKIREKLLKQKGSPYVKVVKFKLNTIKNKK